MLVTKEMTIEQVLKLNPATANIFMGMGMHCLGCAVASGESVEQAALAHGVDVSKLVDDLNKVAAS